MSQFDYKDQYHRKLPHLQPPGATLFVTFRLADSIPLAVLRELSEENDEAEKRLTFIEDKEERARQAALERRKYFGKWDNTLDAATNGPFWLGEDKIAELVSSALHYQDNKRYRLDAFCIMPNHVHLICAPLVQSDNTYYSLSSIMHALKRHTAYHANQLLERNGAFWQRENYDHYVRDETEFNRIVNYVLNNPVTAGLVSHPDEWKWSYCRTNL